MNTRHWHANSLYYHWPLTFWQLRHKQRQNRPLSAGALVFDGHSSISSHIIQYLRKSRSQSGDTTQGKGVLAARSDFISNAFANAVPNAFAWHGGIYHHVVSRDCHVMGWPYNYWIQWRLVNILIYIYITFIPVQIGEKTSCKWKKQLSTLIVWNTVASSIFW